MAQKIPEHFIPLSSLFAAMDRTWSEVADQYGFQCTGCKDNCCLSLFYHHTHVEKAYLLYGFGQLPPEEKEDVLDRARAYCDITFSDGGAVSRKTPCPLLQKGKCRLYTFRPMICRMHGLPHELHRPGHPPVQGPGCAAGAFETRSYIPFDRTPFYREMAAVEMAFRARQGNTGKIRQTVAQILLDADPV